MSVSSQAVAQFVVNGAVGAEERAEAAIAVLDTIAVMIAGGNEPVIQRLARTLGDTPASPRPGLTYGQRLSAQDAALLYGSSAHVLDYDDVSMVAICHPSAPIVAALLAGLPWTEISGAALCDALAIGSEMMIRMGQAMGMRHYELGFHNTATLGTFGATAALARLTGFAPVVAHTALAIAASMAAGMRLNFGTPIKPFHAGLAASHGARAVAWAAAGFSASEADLFGDRGVLFTLSGGSLGAWPDHVTLGSPFAITNPGFSRKRHPCCYLLHKPIAIGRAMAAEGITIDQLTRIEVEMPAGAMLPLIYPSPRTGREAQFSLPYALLAAILDGDVMLASFSDETVANPALRARLQDVHVTEVGGQSLSPAEIDAGEVRVTARFRDGTVRQWSRCDAPGSACDPLPALELRQKWIDCLGRNNPNLATSSAVELYDIGVRALASPEPLEPWLSRVWAATIGAAGNTESE